MKQTGDKWIDESGTQIPSNRITKIEKKQEQYAQKCLKSALEATKRLIKLKELIDGSTDEVYQMMLKEANIESKDKKGTYTWFSFDRSIKIEYKVQEKIVFDEGLIQICREKLTSFLDGSLSSNEDFIKDLVLDAFQTRNNKLDTKKVLSLLKYKSKIKNKTYQESMDLLERSIRRPDQSAYSRIFVKNSEGKYQVVQLNYSAL